MNRKRRTNQGFSLTEVVCAVAMLTATALPVLGVLSVGLKDSQDAWDRRSLAHLRSSVAQYLQDPAWPSQRNGGAQWEAQVWMGSDGSLLPRRDTGAGTVRLEIKSMTGLGYDSPYLEAVQVRFYAGESKLLLGQCVQQRMRR